MKYSPNTAWIIWGIMIAVLVIIVISRWKILFSKEAAKSDLIVALLLVALALAPMFPHVEFFGMKLLRDIKQDVDNVKSQVSSLSANISSQVNVNLEQKILDAVEAKQAEPKIQGEIIKKRSPTEYKILKTFWTKQVNRYDEWLKRKVWTFRINSPLHEFLNWRKAATELILEGLVMESKQGTIYLTNEGFEYCKNHYKEFGEAEYWPKETINDEMLKKVLDEKKT